MIFDDPKESDIPKACKSFQMKVWTMMIQKKIDDPQVIDDHRGISIESMDVILQ